MWIAIQNAVGARQGVGGGPGPTPPYTPPMDAYPADVAYSVRLVSTSYTGPCIEAYRVSDGATQDIGFDSNGRISATELAAFSGGSVLEVQTWYDQMPGANHAISTINDTTGTLTRAIIYSGSSIITDGIEPALDFVNPTDYPTLRFSNLGAASGYESFQVSTAATTNSGTPLYVTSIPYNFNYHQPISYPNGNVYEGFGSNTRPALLGIGFPNMYMQHVYNTTAGPTKNVLINNTLIATASSAANIGSLSHYISAMAKTQVGDDPKGRYIGYIKELFIYKSIQTSGVRDVLTSNINNFYQIGNFPDYTSGFLADYSGAAAAYSVRKLSNTAIKALRVRRTVAPFDEQDIGFTAGGDLDEAAITTFGGSDVLVVSRWYDQSGGSVHATQVTPNQPTIFDGTSVVTDNGRPALDFDGINDWFEIPSTQWSDGEVGVAVVMNASYNVGSASYLMTDTTILRGAYGSSGSFIIHYPTTPNQTNASNPTNGQRLITWDVSSGNASLRYDGAVAATQAVTGSISTASSTAEIGRRTNGTSYVNGTIQELVVWRTGTNIPAIETNINDYYTVIINPDAATSGFLFDYSNATTAYSVRQLNNNAEYCMQVQRSDGERLYVGFVAGDLDTQAIIDFGGALEVGIYRWFDQSGNQNHATLFDLNDPPQIYDGSSIISLNGNPAIYAPATGTRMAVPSQTLTDASVLCVYELSTGSYPINNEAAPRYRLRFFSGRMYLYLDGATISGSLASAGDHQLHTFYDDGATIYWRTNGGDEYTRAFTGSTKHERIIGNISSGMKFQEYILFDTNKYSDRSGIESDAMTYFNIP